MWVLLLLFAALALFWPQSASAQDVPATTANKELEALVQTIENPDQRAELLKTLKALIAASQQAAPPPERPSERLIDIVGDTANTLTETGREFAGYLGNWRDVTRWFDRLRDDPARRTTALRIVRNLAIILGTGWILEFLVWRLLVPTRRRIASLPDTAVVNRIPRVLAAAAVYVAPVAAFALGTHGAFLAVRPDSSLGAVALKFAIAYALIRGIRVLARLLLQPEIPRLRLLSMESAIAERVLRSINLLSWVGVVGYFLVETARLLGLSERGAVGLLRVLGVVIVFLLIVFVLRFRRPVSVWLRRMSTGLGGIGAPLVRWLATGWPIIAIVYLVGLFVAWAWQIKGGFAFLLEATLLSVAVIIVAALVQRLLLTAVQVPRRPSTDIGPDRRRVLDRARPYLPVLASIVRFVIPLAALVVLAEVWGLEALAMLDTPLGTRVIGAAVVIGIVIFVSVVVWEAAGAAIENYLVRTAAGPIDRAARARTLLPLLKKVLLFFLGLIVALIVLSELGVNVGPLIAGAGVIGLAIGFGSQKLVQDVITGIFILVEDAIAVGDVVQVAGTGGLVEAMSVRSIRLRDLAGNVHTIPFSSVDTVTNMTKDFSYYVMDVAVNYREDTDRVVNMLKEIDEKLRVDPEFAPAILAPIEVLGVDAFADSAVIIKARIKTKPIEQWRIGREFNRRLKRRFDDSGVEIPFPHRTVIIERSSEADAAMAAPAVTPAAKPRRGRRRSAPDGGSHTS